MACNDQRRLKGNDFKSDLATRFRTPAHRLGSLRSGETTMVMST